MQHVLPQSMTICLSPSDVRYLKNVKAQFRRKDEERLEWLQLHADGEEEEEDVVNDT